MYRVEVMLENALKAALGDRPILTEVQLKEAAQSGTLNSQMVSDYMQFGKGRLLDGSQARFDDPADQQRDLKARERAAYLLDLQPERASWKEIAAAETERNAYLKSASEREQKYQQERWETKLKKLSQLDFKQQIWDKKLNFMSNSSDLVQSQKPTSPSETLEQEAARKNLTGIQMKYYGI